MLGTALVGRALPPNLAGVAEKNPLTGLVIQPKRIVRKSGQGISNSENLLNLGSIPELADPVLRVIASKTEPMRVITMHLDRNMKGLL